jgi:hypothetical protein
VQRFAIRLCGEGTVNEFLTRWEVASVAQAKALETYTRTLSTMGKVLQTLRDEPDPDGSLALLVERIEIEREWVRVLRALGVEPRRPPGWLRHSELATR